MSKLWKGVVVAGAMFWIFIGTFTFYGNLESGRSQLAGAGYTWEDDYIAEYEDRVFLDGPYVHEVDPFDDVEVYEEIFVRDDPWYVRAFPGFGAIAHNLIPGAAPSAQEPIVVRQPPIRPTCVITVSPSSVPYGGRAIVTWTSRHAQSAVLQGIGSVAPSSAYAANSLTATRTFVLAVSGAGGANTCYATVNVEPLVLKTPSCIISTYPHTVSAGERVSLAWGSENASSATLSGFGSVSVKGGVDIYPNVSKSYTLTVYTVNGKSATCQTNVTVE